MRELDKICQVVRESEKVEDRCARDHPFGDHIPIFKSLMTFAHHSVHGILSSLSLHPSLVQNLPLSLLAKWVSHFLRTLDCWQRWSIGGVQPRFFNVLSLLFQLSLRQPTIGRYVNGGNKSFEALDYKCGHLSDLTINATQTHVFLLFLRL